VEGVGTSIAKIIPGTPTVNLMYRMDSRCTNKQDGVFAILKALEYIQTNLENEEDKVVIVHTGSRTTLDSLNNANKQTYLTEGIRQKCTIWKPENGEYDSDR